MANRELMVRKTRGAENLCCSECAWCFSRTISEAEGSQQDVNLEYYHAVHHAYALHRCNDFPVKVERLSNAS